MSGSTRKFLAGAAVVLLGAPAVAAAPASGASISVNVRVEGSSSTLFEGPVSTEPVVAPGISTKSSGGAHPCDVKDNGKNEGFGAPAVTPTAALYAAATASAVTFDASWSAGELNDFFVTQVGPDTNGGAPEFPSWGYAVNYTTAGVGGCQFQLAPGSEVLWAYNYFNLAHLLSLSGSAKASIGTPVTVHVVDGQTGQPVSGAAIGEFSHGVTTPIVGSPLTDASGNASISLTHLGVVTLKATRSDSVRSNGIVICVHNGNDGTCGTSAAPTGPVSAPPASVVPAKVILANVAQVVGIKSGRRYARRVAPRELLGAVQVPAGGTLRDVRIRLQRRVHGHCFDFSGSREAFVRSKSCGPAPFFSIGASESFSYLLPARLSEGRYVYDVEAADNAGHVSNLVSGVSHVVFRVL